MTDARQLDRAELDNLLALLEDRDEVTFEVVSDRVFALGRNALDYFFRNVYRQTEPYRRSFVLKRICQMSSLLAYKELLDLMRTGPDLYVPDGMYFLTRIMEPELTPDAFRGCYEDVGNSLLCELTDSMTAVERVEMLNYTMYDKYGFALSAPSGKEDEPNVLLPRLLKRRKGGTVGLSCVYFLLASYAGLPVYPVFPKSPGYFVTWMEQGRSLFTIDVGNHGRISEPVPRSVWKDTPLMGTGQTILYIYAAALKRFSPANSTRLTDILLTRALDVLRV